MNTYYLKILLFNFLINILVLPHNENCEISHYNIILITKNAQETIIKSRLLAQTQNHNPHYHNDPELKEMIDKLNEEAIKKYQQTHDPYKQLKEVVEKNGTKPVGVHVAEPMSTIEKDLFKTYEEMFGNKNHFMLKSSIYINQDDKYCECANKNKSYNLLTSSNKVHDIYLDNLKDGCVGGAGICTFSSAATGFSGVVAGAASIETVSKTPVVFWLPTQSLKISFLTSNFLPYGIAIAVLIAVTIIVILLYVYLRNRRKHSWKHECKKHLCT
ncbi:stevor PIR protein, putative [Plasmodium reichenowi]|uniref:Stevor PIR protein, putative n=1 Tax=Plasmodium reichenowi TaxID=5854 RepID=A0A2P9DS96_PLARE|nr:stevor PIR protein, putative [Plasmodium reichenowi]